MKESQNPLTATVLRDGKYLIVRSGAVLPAICPVTAQPLAPGSPLKRRTLIWIPRWAFVSLITGPLLVVFIVCVYKRGAITYGVSEAERKRTERMKRLAWLFVVGVYACFALESFFGSGFWWARAVAAALLLPACLCLISAPSLKVAGYRKGEWFKLGGCTPEFLDTLPAGKFEDLH